MRSEAMPCLLAMFVALVSAAPAAFAQRAAESAPAAAQEASAGAGKAAASSGPASVAPATGKARKRRFIPSEKVSADSAVAFPVDI